MGYCFTSGRLESGKIVFTKCDGRSNICILDKDIISNVPTDKNYKANKCGEYCKNIKIAKILLYDFLKDKKLDNIRDKEIFNWLKNNIEG